MDDPTTPTIDPRARQIAELVTRADRLAREEEEEIETVRRKFATERLRIQTLLANLMGMVGPALPPPPNSLAIVRKGKPKKQWRKVADFIATHPGCGYQELGQEVYDGEELDEQKIKNLRALLYQMRKAKVVSGEPGSWRLLKTPEEIEWTKTEDEAA